MLTTELNKLIIFETFFKNVMFNVLSPNFGFDLAQLTLRLKRISVKSFALYLELIYHVRIIKLVIQPVYIKDKKQV